MNIELDELRMLAIFTGALVPGFIWTGRARTPQQMGVRAAIVGSVLVSAAILGGRRSRARS